MAASTIHYDSSNASHALWNNERRGLFVLHVVTEIELGNMGWNDGVLSMVLLVHATKTKNPKTNSGKRRQWTEYILSSGKNSRDKDFVSIPMVYCWANAIECAPETERKGRGANFFHHTFLVVLRSSICIFILLCSTLPISFTYKTQTNRNREQSFGKTWDDDENEKCDTSCSTAQRKIRNKMFTKCFNFNNIYYKCSFCSFIGGGGGNGDDDGV